MILSHLPTSRFPAVSYALRIHFLILLAILSTVANVGCSYSEEGREQQAPATTTNVVSLGAAGSTFIAPLMERWSTDFQKTHPIHVNYRPIGSGAGIEEMKKGFLDFAASDAPLSDDELRGMPSVIQVPASAGPVCVIYNVPGFTGQLRFSPQTLAGIFSGNIISWQDSAILKDNPSAKLPRMAIILVHRSDGSGTTNILSSYLDKVGAPWKLGHGLKVKWAAGLAVEGSKNIFATVSQTPGTIGYLELSYARQSTGVAAIQNRAGHFIAPTPGSAAAALNAFAPQLRTDVRTPIVDPPATANDAYPISGITFLLVRRQASDSQRQGAIKQFVDYALTEGQNAANDLSYARLPNPIQQDGQSLAGQLETK